MADSAMDVALVTAKEPTTAVPNRLPIADAGENQVLKLGYTTFLDGAGSRDPDGNPLTFAWTMVDGPVGSNPTISDPKLIRPSIRPDIGGTYKFNLTVNDGIVDSLADTVTIITTEGRSEIEPNNASTTAQTMVDIGLNSPIGASINNSTDVDWFRFSVEKDQTYVIELFNVSDAFRDPVGTKCGASSNGLYAKLVDQAGTAITSRCAPVGSGDVHTYLEFKASYKGPYLLQIGANSTAIGDYNLRVLPGIGSDKAMWDPATMEPNNRMYTAYKLDLGHTHAKVAAFEPRSSAYTTNRADVDWYRIDVSAGQTYVVEILDAALGLVQTAGRDCTGAFTYDSWGLSLTAFDDSFVKQKEQCTPVGAGNVHTMLAFTASKAGVYYFQVASNALTSSDNGTYSIRAEPKHNDTAASWDPVTLEPNNTLSTAHEMGFGKVGALTSTFVRRTSNIATNRADLDWYRFHAKAGQAYLVEIFDVSLGLAQTAGRDCTGAFTYDSFGLSLKVYDSSSVKQKEQCTPVGTGNVHNMLEFTAKDDGDYYVYVASNSLTSNDSGSYSIRVSPKHTDADASWDPVTFEPNNTLSTAYALSVALENALTSTFIPRPSNVATVYADVDWFRFSATANQQYVVELFDVAAGLAQTEGRDCLGAFVGSAKGLSLKVFGADGVKHKEQCTPVGAGNVHNTLSFTAPATGIYYVQVASNALSSFDRGTYSIRITPK